MKTHLYFSLFLFAMIFLIPQYVHASITAEPRTDSLRNSIIVDIAIDEYAGGSVDWVAHLPDNSTLTGTIDNLVDGKASHKIPIGSSSQYGRWSIDYIYGDQKKTTTFIVEIDSYSGNKNSTELFNSGLESMNRGNLTEAISYFDSVLQIHPNDTAALVNKGNALARLGNPYTAMHYFDEALKIDPGNHLARSNLNIARSELDYYDIDGFVEVQVRDSQGHLVAFLKTSGLRVLNHTFAQNFVDHWPTKGVITRDGKTFEIIQFNATETIPSDTVYGQTRVIHRENPSAAVVFYSNWGYPLEKGDRVTAVYTIFKPLA